MQENTVTVKIAFVWTVAVTSKAHDNLASVLFSNLISISSSIETLLFLWFWSTLICNLPCSLLPHALLSQLSYAGASKPRTPAWKHLQPDLKAYFLQNTFGFYTTWCRLYLITFLCFPVVLFANCHQGYLDYRFRLLLSSRHIAIRSLRLGIDTIVHNKLSQNAVASNNIHFPSKKERTYSWPTICKCPIVYQQFIFWKFINSCLFGRGKIIFNCGFDLDAFIIFIIFI